MSVVHFTAEELVNVAIAATERPLQNVTAMLACVVALAECSKANTAAYVASYGDRDGVSAVTVDEMLVTVDLHSAVTAADALVTLGMLSSNTTDRHGVNHLSPELMGQLFVMHRALARRVIESQGRRISELEKAARKAA